MMWAMPHNNNEKQPQSKEVPGCTNACLAGWGRPLLRASRGTFNAIALPETLYRAMLPAPPLPHLGEISLAPRGALFDMVTSLSQNDGSQNLCRGVRDEGDSLYLGVCAAWLRPERALSQ